MSRHWWRFAATFCWGTLGSFEEWSSDVSPWIVLPAHILCSHPVHWVQAVPYHISTMLEFCYRCHHSLLWINTFMFSYSFGTETSLIRARPFWWWWSNPMLVACRLSSRWLLHTVSAVPMPLPAWTVVWVSDSLGWTILKPSRRIKSQYPVSVYWSSCGCGTSAQEQQQQPSSTLFSSVGQVYNYLQNCPSVGFLPCQSHS